MNVVKLFIYVVALIILFTATIGSAICFAAYMLAGHFGPGIIAGVALCASVGMLGEVLRKR